MRTFILGLALLASTFSNSQSISLSDLVGFKKMNFGNIEENLILSDWDFLSSDQKEKDIRNFVIEGYKSITFGSNDYSYEKSFLTITNYENKSFNKVELTTENKRIYQTILSDLINNGFRINHSESGGYKSFDLSEPKIGQKKLIECNPKLYEKGNLKVVAIINRYVVVSDTNPYEGTFSYSNNDITTQYEILLPE